MIPVCILFIRDFCNHIYQTKSWRKEVNSCSLSRKLNTFMDGMSSSSCFTHLAMPRAGMCSASRHSGSVSIARSKQSGLFLSHSFKNNRNILKGTTKIHRAAGHLRRLPCFQSQGKKVVGTLKKKYLTQKIRVLKLNAKA